jgi:hypothetical protein
MDLQAVSTAIVDALSGLNVRAYDYGPDDPVSPAAFVYPLDIVQYFATFDGTADVNMCVRFLVSSVATRAGQAELNGFISPGVGSAVTALQADNTLGGVVSTSRVTSMRNYGVVTLADGIRYYSAELIVEVWA